MLQLTLVQGLDEKTRDQLREQAVHLFTYYPLCRCPDDASLSFASYAHLCCVGVYAFIITVASAQLVVPCKYN